MISATKAVSYTTLRDMIHRKPHALEMALGQRQPVGELIHHSDRGGQYLSDDYQNLLSCYGVTCSMSDRGSCYDNAVVTDPAQKVTPTFTRDPDRIRFYT